MRPSAFLLIGIMVCALALLLFGCTKTESPDGGDRPGIRLGFVEKEDAWAAPPPEPTMPDEQEQETPPVAAALARPTEPVREQENASEPEPAGEAPIVSPIKDVQNETVADVPDASATNTTSEANSSSHDPATGQGQSSGNLTNSSGSEPSDDGPLGFEIRIDANRYYQSGAGRCHDSTLAQCVHVNIGPENCGADCHFDPEAIMVPVGTTIEWGNHDTVAHQVIAQDETFVSNLIDPLVSANRTYPNYDASHFSFPFNAPGEYRYHGEPGSGHTGIVIVVSSFS